MSIAAQSFSEDAIVERSSSVSEAIGHDEMIVFLDKATAIPAIPTLDYMPNELRHRIGVLCRDALVHHCDAEREAFERKGVEALAKAKEASQWLWLIASLLTRRPKRVAESQRPDGRSHSRGIAVTATVRS